MASPLPPWFTLIFTFENMLIAICILIAVIVIILAKMGPVGRFFLNINVMPGSKKILLAKGLTNELKFFRVKEKGRALQINRDSYMFLPDFRRAKPTENLSEDEQIFNEMLVKPSHIDGKIIYMGALSASVAANPHLMETLETAKSGSKEVQTFFKGLETTFGTNVKRLNIVTPFNIQTLAMIMNRVITPQRLKMVFKEGELVGLNRHRTREMALYIVIGALVICVLGLAYMVTRA